MGGSNFDHTSHPDNLILISMSIVITFGEEIAADVTIITIDTFRIIARRLVPVRIKKEISRSIGCTQWQFELPDRIRNLSFARLGCNRGVL